MKSQSFLTLALACVSPALAASDLENTQACGKKGPATNLAIAKFCNKQSNGQFVENMVVPSDYASTGVTQDNIKVRITGDCSPKQWVPTQYCLSQFHAMCAKSGKAHGEGQGKYGKNGCQNWNIIYLGLDSEKPKKPAGITIVPVHTGLSDEERGKAALESIKHAPTTYTGPGKVL